MSKSSVRSVSRTPCPRSSISEITSVSVASTFFSSALRSAFATRASLLRSFSIATSRRAALLVEPSGARGAPPAAAAASALPAAPLGTGAGAAGAACTLPFPILSAGLAGNHHH